MAKKKPKLKSKSHVAHKAKKNTFKFTWWMATIGVITIALVGIVVLRYSRAADQNAELTNNPSK